MTANSSGAAPMPASILDLLGDLDGAVAHLANTWKPEDPNYRADVYRQVMMNLSYAYFAHFTADPEHPDWIPLFNPVFMQQPNPDTLYQYTPLRGDLTYRLSGSRGTCNSIVFTTQKGFTGGSGDIADFGHFNIIDDTQLEIGADGEFEIILSAARPEGHAGNWMQIEPETNSLMVRYVAQDWANERDPQLSIECLDDVPLKPRLAPEEIVARIREMAKLPANMDALFFTMQNGVKERVGVNAFDLFVQHGVDFQYYWPAVFEFSPGEALIIETEIPEVAPYWNLQLNDPYFNAVEYVYRLSCTNGHYAKVGPDRMFRAVVSLEDPGVPNWLDPAGFTEGTLWGRWYGCSSTPTPTIKRVPFAQLRDHLPSDTPTVTPAERAAEIRERVRACQRRRRW